MFIASGISIGAILAVLAVIAVIVVLFVIFSFFNTWLKAMLAGAPRQHGYSSCNEA